MKPLPLLVVLFLLAPSIRCSDDDQFEGVGKVYATLRIESVPGSAFYFHYINRAQAFISDVSNGDTLLGIADFVSERLPATAFRDYDSTVVRFTDSTVVGLRAGATLVVFDHEFGRDTARVVVNAMLEPEVVE